MSNIWVVFKGVPAERTGQLEAWDLTAKKNLPVALATFTSIQALIQTTPTATPLLTLTCTVLDAFTLKCAFSQANVDALAIHLTGYLLSFKGNTATIPVYFPLNRVLERTYGRLIVQDPLG